jgi:peroxiredoxin
MDAILIVLLILPWFLIAVLTWLLYTLVRQHGRVLVRFDDLHDRVAAIEQLVTRAAGTPEHATEQPLGLSPGTPAPDFTLPDLEGRQRQLGEFLGAPLLLVFFNPRCGFCQKIAPQLAEIGGEGARILLVSRGEPGEHRRLAREHGWRCDVVLEPDWAVAESYAVPGTPAGYLVAPDGRISTPLAVGADALIALARGEMDGGPASDASLARARTAGVSVRDISASRINRSGLPAGTPAPNFRLPDLAGRERALAEFRGKRVLLVFSDPDCGPCDALAPELVDVHERHRDDGLEVVMISRGEPYANRAKAKELGYTFPVLLQPGWSVSKQYGLFATPVAYLIDEEGMIALEPAIGRDAILSLV